ncbi:transcription elongation factor GreB [Swaminathania salitolerans]|uniref:Transcription elongation factor GreB n=1 Tax=Swaminathania salitolerans TaxID=182838 RepID=A0A511BMC5_9PROT|nr:transcription elongation factor GreB [Swaminathania salitolerans]GBQ15777.1 transcription elongation factor GreB [Swaminathania salitolerans LMG 21291]GEL01481.1 transcription elongation factor GreB [Swaminathania salitolerans]
MSPVGEQGKPALSLYLSPRGAARMRDELNALLQIERPRIVEIVSWAAGNGDRSENGDYIYGKRRLREIDRRIRFLTRRLDNAIIVDPREQSVRDRVFFGARVRYLDEDDTLHTVTICGCDEADLSRQEISLVSPVARALMRARVGDEVSLQSPRGAVTLEIRSIDYPD